MDLKNAREQFPALAAAANGNRPLVYLDNAATTLKPRCVIDAVANTLAAGMGPVHRSVNEAGDWATEVYEDARRTVAWHIGAEPNEVVFVRNATEGVNLVAAGWPPVRQGGVLVSNTDHHSAVLPWKDRAIRLSPTSDGTLDLGALEAALSTQPVELVAISHISNVTGATVDVPALADLVHSHGALLLLDAAQSAPHRSLDVLDLDCDFLVFSSHKMCGPSGIGALYGKAEHLQRLEPMLRGGSMVEHVGLDTIRLNDVPFRFEAGSPALEAAAGFKAALEFLQAVGLERISEHQRSLTHRALERVPQLPNIRLLWTPGSIECGPLTFALPGHSPHRIARSLSDAYRICVRSGLHCAEPLHISLGVPASLRASFYLYNTADEVEYFFDSLETLLRLAPKG